MKKLKLLLVGAQGKMGIEIRDLLISSEHFRALIDPSVALIRSGKCPGFKKTVTSFAQISKTDVDIIVDFSSPELMRKTLQFAVKMEIPLVCGVTGLSESDFKSIKTAAKKTSILWAPNMSLGVAVLKAALEHFSSLQGYDFQIVESHHDQKKDSPSGTAIALQKILEENIRAKVPAPLSIRGGGIVGDHSVLAMSEDEVLEFSHRALKRSVFAKGALMAALWLSKRRNGFFEIEDVIRDG
jgi:4-hydroxy-tetrahydrodipicolinate reductase